MDAALPLTIICVGMATYGFSASLTSALTALALYLLAAPTGFTLPLIPLYLAVGLIVYVLALSALRALTLTDLQLLAKILPGGTRLYGRTLKTVRNHPTLLILAKKLLA